MTQNIDRLALSHMRVRNARASVEKMRRLADNLCTKPAQHQRAVATLMLLEDSLFELTEAHALLERIYR